jgi:hypothetical protein
MFNTDRSFGQKTMQVEVQSTPRCLGSYSTVPGSLGPYFPTPCVENRRWTFHKVAFATVDLQGTCNNLCTSGSGAPDAGGDPPEYAGSHRRSSIHRAAMCSRSKRKSSRQIERRFQRRNRIETPSRLARSPRWARRSEESPRSTR